METSRDVRDDRAQIAEQIFPEKRVLREVHLVKYGEDHPEGADDQRSNGGNIAPGVVVGRVHDLRAAPRDGDEEGRCGAREAESAQPVDPADLLTGGGRSGSQGQEVWDGDQAEPADGEHQVEDPAPRCLLGDRAAEDGSDGEADSPGSESSKFRR